MHRSERPLGSANRGALAIENGERVLLIGRNGGCEIAPCAPELSAERMPQPMQRASRFRPLSATFVRLLRDEKAGDGPFRNPARNARRQKKPRLAHDRRFQQNARGRCSRRPKFHWRQDCRRRRSVAPIGHAGKNSTVRSTQDANPSGSGCRLNHPGYSGDSLA